MAQYATSLDFTNAYQESFATFSEALIQVEKQLEYVQFIKDNTKQASHTCIVHVHIL